MTILFNELPILEETKKAIDALGFEELTPIQALAIPEAVKGIDIIGQAQTGTGKTFAFGIPMIEKINTSLRETQGLILCPTRELATQVFKEILKLVKFNKHINVTLIVGGESYERQFKALKSSPHIIIGTPGRMIDHMERGTVDLSTVTTLALDEADEMLKMGFQEDMENIMSHIAEERQILLFSATMPTAIKKIAKIYQRDPQILKVESKTLTVDQIKQTYYIVKNTEKLASLPRLLDYTQSKSTIIFSNTKADVDRITEYLLNNGYLADALHGDIKQRSRSDVMRRFRDRQIEILVGTDVAARGLDVNGVELVINYDLPYEKEVYVHRIGRTGRAGRTGLAYSLISPRKQSQLRELEFFIKAKIEYSDIPSIQDIKKAQLDAFKDGLKEKLNHDYSDHLKDIQDILEDTSKEDLINALLHQVMPKPKYYDDIESINPRKPREKSSRNGKKAKYQDFIINIGSKDKMTPMKFLKMMDRTFNVYQKNIGDIKIDKVYTRFGIKQEGVSKMRFTKGRYEGKVVEIKNA